MRKVKQILATEPVSVIYNMAFQVFASEVGRLKRVTREDAELVRCLFGVLAKWRDRHLDERIMRRILSEIFEIVLPDSDGAPGTAGAAEVQSVGRKEKA